MFLWLSLLLLITPQSYGQVGKILKKIGPGEAFILRNNKKIIIKKDTLLNLGDEVSSVKSVLLIHLEPTLQMSVGQDTVLKISEYLLEGDEKKEKSTSVIDFLKGIVRLQVNKYHDLEVNQKIRTKDVAFGVRGTEFEVSNDGENVDLDVIEGEVEVTSPHVQTFVPEIVKRYEGFRFNLKRRDFQRRKFLSKFKDHPGFQSRSEIRELWLQKKRELVERRFKRSGVKSRREDILERRRGNRGR
jgi:hypothetical protein